MAGTYSNGTVTFTYSTTAAKTLKILDAAAHYLFNQQGVGVSESSKVVYADLTNQQKLDLVDKAVRELLMNLARAYNVTTQMDAAKQAAILDAQTNLNLP